MSQIDEVIFIWIHNFCTMAIIQTLKYKVQFVIQTVANKIREH